MPTPDRTSLEEIVGAARDILESRGLTQLTMQAVAERVGVRAPSLYKRVRNRDDLIRLVIEATHRDLGDQLQAIAGSGDSRRDLGELARALRAFAKARPAAYHLVFARPAGQGRPDLALLAHSSAPLLKVVTDLAGPSEALEGARMITAWATGFISMELAGAFNLGGDLDRAYEYGIAHLTAALAGTGDATRGPGQG
jgi:AcrR family transcriptional regulator